MTVVSRATRYAIAGFDPLPLTVRLPDKHVLHVVRNAGNSQRGMIPYGGNSLWVNPRRGGIVGAGRVAWFSNSRRRESGRWPSDGEESPVQRAGRSRGTGLTRGGQISARKESKASGFICMQYRSPTSTKWPVLSTWYFSLLSRWNFALVGPYEENRPGAKPT